MEKIDFKDYPDTTTPINAENLNKIQDNAEISINEVDTKNTNLKNQVANGWYEIDPTAVLTFSSWDASVYTGVVSTNIDLTSVLSVGMKVKFTQNSATKYAIITAITSTQLTLFMGTDYILENIAISDMYYSMLKAPFGFPLNPNKWTIEVLDTVRRAKESPLANIWYNPEGISITIPVGLWKISYKANAYATREGVGFRTCIMTLSTSTTGDTLTQFKTAGYTYQTDKSTSLQVGATNELELDNKTILFLNISTNQNGLLIIAIDGGFSTTIIKAVCGYL